MLTSSPPWCSPRGELGLAFRHAGAEEHSAACRLCSTLPRQHCLGTVVSTHLHSHRERSAADGFNHHLRIDVQMVYVGEMAKSEPGDSVSCPSRILSTTSNTDSDDQTATDVNGEREATSLARRYGAPACDTPACLIPALPGLDTHDRGTRNVNI